MLELNQLTGQVEAMAEVLAEQRTQLGDLVEQARLKLHEHAQISETLIEKLRRARRVDASWRGAEPQGTDLTERRQLSWPAPPATLLASDGSQIYPDAHGLAFYYLLNVGTIMLRQGSGQAPTTATQSQLFYQPEELFDESSRPIEVDQVNAQRDLWELRALAELVQAERHRVGTDPRRVLVAAADGPLLLWMPQRLSDTEQAQRVDEFARELEAMRRQQAVPVGYVDRPRSANVLRLLHLADLAPGQIDKETLRASRYRLLTDAELYGNLLPGQRTGLFAATSEINRTYGTAGHRILFCYLNVAAHGGERDSIIARVEVPQWAAEDQERFDLALAALWTDCVLTGYPYVLARAHELALVSRHERSGLEQMLRVEMMRRGINVEVSAKQRLKRAT